MFDIWSFSTWLPVISWFIVGLGAAAAWIEKALQDVNHMYQRKQFSKFHRFKFTVVWCGGVSLVTSRFGCSQKFTHSRLKDAKGSVVASLFWHEFKLFRVWSRYRISDLCITWKGFGWSAKGFLAAGLAVFSWVDISDQRRHSAGGFM